MPDDASRFPAPSAEQQRNMDTVRKVLTRLWIGGEMEIADEVFPPSFVRHDANNADSIGAEGYKEIVNKSRKAFPDLEVEIHQIAAAGDRVFFRTTMHGTHQGDFAGIPPTGAPIEVQTHAEVQFGEDGKSVEAWVVTNYLGLIQTLMKAMSFWQIVKNLPKILKQSGFGRSKASKYGDHD